MEQIDKQTQPQQEVNDYYNNLFEEDNQPQPQAPVQPTPQPAVTQPVASQTPEQEVNDYYNNLFEEDNQPVQPQPQTYNPEDLDYFKEILDSEEYEYLLGKAAELNNPQEVERLVESNPEQAERVIADNTPLDIEAKQAEDGGSDKEVDNEAVENFIEEHNNPNTPDPLGMDDFIKDIEQQESKEHPAAALTNEINKQLSTHPMKSVLENKLRNMFIDFRKSKDAKFNNALSGANEGWESALNKAAKYDPNLVNRIRDLMKDPDALIRKSVGLDLSNPQMRDYCENKFGHDFVKTQDRQRLSRNLRSKNLALVKYMSKYMDRVDVTNPETGKPYSNYELTGKIAKGELDPKDIFHDKPLVNAKGGVINSQTKARRAKARDAIEELKLNNEIRSYLSGPFDKFIDVSKLKGLSGIELRDALRNQIAGKVDTEIQKDVEQEVDWLEKQEDKQDITEEVQESLVDWSKVKEYKPGEDPIEWLRKDDYDPRVEENLNYEYEEGVGAPGVLTEKDEDFAGPDELPAQIYDNSDFEPKQLPAVINDGLPAEQYYEPVYDTSDYNFDWSWEDITPEQIDQEVDEDEDIPEEEKEEAKKRRKRIVNFIRKRNLASGSGHGVSSSSKPTYDKVNGSMSFGSGKGIMGSASIGNFMANPKWDKPKQEPVKEVKSEASKAPEPVETTAQASPIGVKSNPTTSNRTSNGGFNSGGVNKTGNSLIKVSKVALPNGEANNQPDVTEGLNGQTNNLRDSRIQLLEARIKQLDPELQEHFGFSTKYKHVEYKETPLEECSGGQLQEIEDILEACGV